MSLETPTPSSDVYAVDNQQREIRPGIWWFPQCVMVPFFGTPTHVHQAPYLIVGSEKTLLWDTAAPMQWLGVERSLDEILGDRPLDYVIPSHPEVAHTGNANRLMAKYPELELVGDLRDYPLYFPEFRERMTPLTPGSEIDLGDRKFTLVEAVIKDLPSTQWGYESTQKVLFVGDGFAYSHQAPIEGDDRPTHMPGECASFASELDGDPGPEQIVWITKAALYWTYFVKLDVFFDRFKRTLERYPADLVAPAHGAVIDSQEILWTVWDALKLAYDPRRGVSEAGKDVRERDDG